MEIIKESIIDFLEKLLTITPKQLIIGSIITYFSLKITKCIKNSFDLYRINQKYRLFAIDFRKKRDDKFKRFYEYNNNLYSDQEKTEIKNSSLCELKKFLESGKYSSEKIVKILLLRNYELLKFNYAADINVDETINLAIKADELRRKINESSSKESDLLKYPLLGLPISIKDIFGVKNFQMTQGSAVNLKNPSYSFDSYIIEILKEKGVVPLLMSSVPQGLFAIENENLIFGHAANPHNKLRITGGSSGGEAGLISTHCSPAGLGSDIGGSIRIPSNFCGIYGFKPTSERISKLGTLEYDNNKIKSSFNQIRVSFGPMARSLEDIILLSQEILGSFNKDAYCHNIPFDHKFLSKSQEEKTYNIGILKSDSCNLTEPIENTLNLVVDGLKNSGKNFKFVVVEFPFKRYSEFTRLCVKLLFAARTSQNILNGFQGEYPLKHLDSFKLINMPNYLKKIISFFLGITRNTRMKQLFNETDANISLEEYLEETRRLEEIKNEFINIYQDNKFDALITPVSPYPAIKHSHGNDLSILLDYPILFNFLDFPAGVIPIRKCGKTSKRYEDGYNDFLTRRIRENMVDCEELPIGIQVATMHNKDEYCLEIMSKIVSVLQQNGVIQDLNFVNI